VKEEKRTGKEKEDVVKPAREEKESAAWHEWTDSLEAVEEEGWGGANTPGKRFGERKDCT